MKNEVLLMALKKRKKKKIDWENPEESIKTDKPIAKEDGLSPGPVTQVSAEDEISEEIAEGEVNIEKQAKQVLGRKPMSTVKKGYSEEEDEDDETEFETRDDVLASMSDKNLMESLKSGSRKPKSLWDKVQLNIAKRKK